LNIDMGEVQRVSDLMQKHAAEGVARAKSWTHSGIIRDDNNTTQNGLTCDVNAAVSENTISKAE
jgi:hypothetical protein